MKRILLCLCATTMFGVANAQTIGANGYFDDFNDNVIADDAENGWYVDPGVYSVAESGGQLQVTATNADQYFNGFGLYVKPATGQVDASGNLTLTVDVTNPSTTQSLDIRIDAKFVDAAFTGPNCPVASGDTVNANYGITNVQTIAPNTTATLTYTYTGAQFEYNTTCGGAWTPTQYTISDFTEFVGLYIVINGGAGETWCTDTDGSCDAFSGTVSFDNLTFGTVATGIDEDIAVSSSISPNPTSGSAVVTYAEQSGDVTVSVSDLLGNEVASAAGGSSSADIDASGLASGLYIVTVAVDGTPVSASRLVVE